jgi:SecD/SecF fusion protein
MPYGGEEFGPPEREDSRIVKRLAGKEPQALILMNDGADVTGEYLQRASAGVDETGMPQVNFVFNERGAYLFGQLSGEHLPNPSGQKYCLGIILDKKLLSAPYINSKITSNGRITGIKDQKEVDFVVGILNAGSLPASLNKEPISRETISPTLGKETVAKGKLAIWLSLVIVFAFMAIYYRFAGLVACLALGANVILTIGTMMFLHAAFTLPGLAGVVLSIGMSVDANILIYERIREERKRGAALRMAIRDGFDRAMATIVDSNLTNLITAVAIYKIAPDNVKGFGITLIIGIIMCMYTAVFLSRIIFDIAERTHKLHDLKMLQLIGVPTVDFMGARMKCIAGSLLLIVIGTVGIIGRGRDMLDIDFTGGSSVSLVLNQENKMTFSEVMKLLQQTELKDKNLSLVEVGDTGTRFTINSVEQDVEAVQDLLVKTFGDRLQSYQLKAEDIKAVGEAVSAVPSSPRNAVRLVNFQEVPAAEEPKETTAAEKESEAASAADTTSEKGAEESAASQDSSAEPAAGTESTESAAGAEEVEKLTTVQDPFVGGTQARIVFGSEEAAYDAGVNHETMDLLLRDAIKSAGHQNVAFIATNPDYQTGSARRFAEWDVKLALAPADAQAVFTDLEKTTNSQPVFPLANKIGGRVAGDLRTKAFAAIVVSCVGIVLYVWFRFHRVVYGIAAVVALVHDVWIAVGFMAVSSWLVSLMPGVAQALMIEKFQISLTIVAALLTLIGYSINDTIVVFDRIREIKGKSPFLTGDMINRSVNQTLSRTILTSFATFLSVFILYVWGGDGIHGFAFSLLVGIIVGTYSSIFIASPILLWMGEAEQAKSTAGKS